MHAHTSTQKIYQLTTSRATLCRQHCVMNRAMAAAVQKITSIIVPALQWGYGCLVWDDTEKKTIESFLNVRVEFFNKGHFVHSCIHCLCAWEMDEAMWWGGQQYPPATSPCWSSGCAAWLLIRRSRDWSLATTAVFRWRLSAEARVLWNVGRTEKPEVTEISGALHYSLSDNNLMVLGNKPPEGAELTEKHRVRKNRLLENATLFAKRNESIGSWFTSSQHGCVVLPFDWCSQHAKYYASVCLLVPPTSEVTLLC